MVDGAQIAHKLKLFLINHASRTVHMHQRLDPRLSLKYWLRHFVHPSPNFYRGRRVQHFTSIFRPKSPLMRSIVSKTVNIGNVEKYLGSAGDWPMSSPNLIVRSLHPTLRTSPDNIASPQKWTAKICWIINTCKSDVGCRILLNFVTWSHYRSAKTIKAVND